MVKKELRPVHPGEVLLEEFLKPMGLSQNRLALGIGVSPRRMNEIVLGKRSITADTALRLARYFGNSPQFWLGLQKDYDLDVTTAALGSRLEREVQVSTMAREAHGLYDESTPPGSSKELRESPFIAKVVRKGKREDISEVKENLTFWLSKTPGERVSAVEDLRRQLHGSSARLQRSARVIQLKPRRILRTLKP